MSPAELFKHSYRVDKFIDKYCNEKAFELTDGRKLKLIFSDYVLKMIQDKNQESLRGQILLAEDGKYYRLSELNKSKEFGGRGKGWGVDIETRQIESFNKALDEHKVIPIKIGTDVYDVLELQKTPGIPKSDFHFISKIHKEIAWISHKDGKRSFDFSQYSGITETGIENDKEIKDFIETVKNKFPDGIPRATTVARGIDNKKIKMRSVYGINFGGAFGRQNVTVLLQGDIKLEKDGHNFKINAYHVHLNGDELVGEYEPTLLCTYKGDRSQNGIKGARFSISPKNSRKVNEWV